jgi:serine/threonine-protein kinase
MGKYQVLAHIATGGMGAVYRALDPEKGKEVALKVLNSELAAKPAMIERFVREARTANKLYHENIVEIYEFNSCNGTYFIAMEFVEGVDLHEYVSQKGILDPEESRQIILQASRALRHAHQQNVVHRDIKPSNLLITKSKGRPLVKLTDYGLAREVDVNEFRVTRAGTTVGTLDYMAPEQARDSGQADIRSDLYSLGCTWYHLLAGQAPFPEGGLAERLLKIMDEEPPDVRELNPRVSDATWFILARLLAKDPDERYQTPDELVEDLMGLDGRAAVKNHLTRVKGAAPETHKIAKRTYRGETKAPDVEANSEPSAPMNPIVWLGLGAAGLLAAIAILVLVLRGRRPVDGGDLTKAPPTEKKKDGEVDGGPAKANALVKDGAKKRRPGDKVLVADVPLKNLYTPTNPIPAEELTKEMEAPWVGKKPAGAPPFVARVGRCLNPASGPSFATLASACAAAPMGKAILVEVADNGPLFETPVDVAGRSLTIRAAKGFRPLVIWDVTASREERKKKVKAESPAPLEFIHVVDGDLHLEGIDFALRWPEAAGDEAAILETKNGDLTVRNCTFSAAGRRPEGLTLARWSSSKPAPRRCRFSACFVRGASLTALDLDGQDMEILLEDCLWVGGEAPLVRIQTVDKKTVNLRVARSTLVCGKTLFEVKPASQDTRGPIINWLFWDVLFARNSTQAGGALLSLQDKSDSSGMSLRAYNSLYAGWQWLLASQNQKIAASNLKEWRSAWRQEEGDEVAPLPWPGRDFNEPATLSATTFAPSGPVAFASSESAKQSLGCILARLPGSREHWLGIAFEPLVHAPQTGGGAIEPAIPTAGAGDTRYHGESLDISELDLGAYLTQIKATRRFGPVVVLHLKGRGERPTSPIRIKGSSLVLCFEQQIKGGAALVLKPARGDDHDGTALIDVQRGSLDIYGGELRAPDLAGPKLEYLLHVAGGDLHLHRCRFEGSPERYPTEFQGLALVEGSGEIDKDKARLCSIEESVLVSGRTGIALKGIGIHFLLRQTLVAAGTEALHLDLGSKFKDKANLTGFFENVTFAGRQAVIRLGDSVGNGPPVEPIVLEARDCAFLNPFAGKPNKAGLLQCEGDAASRGLLVWQSERDSFDKRLYYSMARMDTPLPGKPEGVTPWQRLWGAHGVHDVRPLLTMNRYFEVNRWPLERLAPIPAGRGADLIKLGIPIKNKTRP